LEILSVEEASIICEAMKALYQENNQRFMKNIEEINLKMNNFEYKQ